MDSAAPAEASSAFPRAQQGSNPQLLLSGLLADYSFEETAGLTSASIVSLLGEFGITPAGARTALSRVARRGLLVPSREGGVVRYGIGEPSRSTHLERLSRVVRFGAASPPWDGRWTVVTFSVAERERPQRARLRAALEKLQLAPMTDAVWVTPHDRAAEVADVSTELAVNVAIFRATQVEAERTGMSPVAAFDLAGLRARYDAFIATYEPRRDEMSAGALTPSSALVVRTEVLREWRTIGFADPDLPAELLPEDWPLRRAHDVFESLWRGLAPLALLRLTSLLAPRDAEVARGLRWVDV